MISVFGAVSLFLLASSSVPALEPHSIMLRVVGSLVVIAPVVWRKRLSDRSTSPQFSHAMIVMGLGYSSYLIASKFAHGRDLDLLIGLLSFSLVAYLAHALLHYYSTPQVVGGAYAAFLLMCLLSLVTYQLLPDISIENLRLRGVLENANALGFAAFALGAVSIAAHLVRWQSLLGLGVALSCLVLSGSRASMLALIIVAFGLAIGRIRRARIVVAFSSAAVILAWLLSPAALADLFLFRTTDTRSAGFEIVQHAISESFWTGLGELPMATRVAGSPFAAGITGGVLGLIGLGAMYFGLIRGFATSRPRALSLVVAGIVHSLFESWMLSFSAPMLVTFFVLLVGFVGLDTMDDEQRIGRSHLVSHQKRAYPRQGKKPRRAHKRLETISSQHGTIA